MEHLKLSIDACGTAGMHSNRVQSTECQGVRQAEGQTMDNPWIDTKGWVYKYALRRSKASFAEWSTIPWWWWWSGDALKLLWEVRWNCKSWKCNFIYMLWLHNETIQFLCADNTHPHGGISFPGRWPSFSALLRDPQWPVIWPLVTWLTSPQFSCDNNNIM